MFIYMPCLSNLICIYKCIASDMKRETGKRVGVGRDRGRK